jgi:hypothetical protein
MKININGEMKSGEVVSFTPFNEPWAEYHLEDGTIIRFRSTINRIIKLSEPGPDGEPIYISNSSNQMSIEEKK